MAVWISFHSSPDCQKQPKNEKSYYKCVSRYICSLICANDSPFFTPVSTYVIFVKALTTMFSIINNMAFLWFIFAFQAIAAVKSDIINCDQPIIGRQICKVNKTMGNTVIELWPDLFLSGNPLLIASKLTIDSIPEFNENESTITFNAILKLLWNDTRITFKSDDPNA